MHRQDYSHNLYNHKILELEECRGSLVIIFKMTSHIKGKCIDFRFIIADFLKMLDFMLLQLKQCQESLGIPQLESQIINIVLFLGKPCLNRSGDDRARERREAGSACKIITFQSLKRDTKKNWDPSDYSLRPRRISAWDIFKKGFYFVLGYVCSVAQLCLTLQPHGL